MAGLQVGAEGRGIAVFGGMAELGEDSESLHRRLGEQVVNSNHDVLVFVGRDAGAIADGALAAGMSSASVHRVDDVNAAHRLLRGELRAGDRVLCKASRRVQLDRLVDRLVGELGNVGRHGATEVSRG